MDGKDLTKKGSVLRDFRVNQVNNITLRCDNKAVNLLSSY